MYDFSVVWLTRPPFLGPVLLFMSVNSLTVNNLKRLSHNYTHMYV